MIFNFPSFSADSAVRLDKKLNFPNQISLILRRMDMILNFPSL